MPTANLPYYIKCFSKLRVDRSKGEPAPHKPILLLSIIQLIIKKEITENKVFISPELVATFKDLWNGLVKSTKFTDNFSLPFYHLKSEGFWTLYTYTGKEIILTTSYSIKSFSQLKDSIEYASFNDDLFALLLNSEDREILQQTLLQVYFPSINLNQLSLSDNIAQIITNQILKEPVAVYQKQVAEADEEEIFIRSGVFKKVVPAIYNNTCCITKMQVVSTYNIQMIDACHIVPFSVSHDDTISNGISLCPNLHRAFDRGLISIGNDYRVMVSECFHEANGDYSIKQYAGSQIHLPNEHNYLPHMDNIAWHRTHIFK